MDQIKTIRRFLPLAMLLLLLSCQEKNQIGLAGRWAFATDSTNLGIAEKWYTKKLGKTVFLPGSMAENGKGNDVNTNTQWTGQVVDRSWYTDSLYEPYRKPGNIKIPFWLTPTKHYVGPAWYQKEIVIPKNWNNQTLELCLERSHWEVMVWMDSNYIDKKNSLSTPNLFHIKGLEPGRHTLTLRIDNQVKIDVGINAHSISDHTQSNWNGIIGRIELSKQPRLDIQNVKVFPDLEKESARIIYSIFNHTGEEQNAIIQSVAKAEYGDKTHNPQAIECSVKLDPGLNMVENFYPLGNDLLTWDEFEPAVYTLTSSLEQGTTTNEYITSFGMREFRVNGTQFEINGTKIFLRGTLECAIFPLTGYPPTDVSSWKKVLQTIKDYGLNHMRFHSWCPPEAAFIAADELGVYLQVECGAWATIGNGAPVDDFIMEESKRIVETYGNHPSFCLMAYGNEPGGMNQGKYLTNFLDYWKQEDNRRVYTGAAGWPVLEANDYHNIPQPRGHQWGEGLSSRFNSEALNMNYDYRTILEKYNKPVVSHEIGQWCVFPDLSEIPKYTGVLKAKNFEIVQDGLKAKGMLQQAHDFLMASGKWQALLYKEEIETALRTPGFAGFQLLDLHDFPGQGTALVGVLNPFWESKGYTDARSFRSFCNSIVPLARLHKRVFSSNDTLWIPIEIANYSKSRIETDIWVRAMDQNNKEVINDNLKNHSINSGGITFIDSVPIVLSPFKQPVQLSLSVGLSTHNEIINSWDIWVYPEEKVDYEYEEITITTKIDTAIKKLKEGGKVMLNLSPRTIGSNVPGGFTTIFWNTAWTRKQKPHTLGLLCDADHPVFNNFPTDFHTNWQWYDIISQSRPMNLDNWPADMSPLIQIIDDWNTNRKLGVLLEANLYGGKLVLSSIDFGESLNNSLVARQLLSSVIDYMESDQFNPVIVIGEKELLNLVKPFNIMTEARVLNKTYEVPGYEAENAVDQDPESFWHTPWTGEIPEHPHELDLDLKTPVEIKGFRFTPRQDGITGGMISKCLVYLSMDGLTWNTPVVVVHFKRSMDIKEIRLEQSRTARYVKIISTEGFEGQTFSSLAEFEVLTGISDPIRQ